MGILNGKPSFNIAAWISSWILEWKIDWDTDYLPKKSEVRQQKKKYKQRTHFVKRSLIVAVGGILFLSILTSAICQNLEIEINGEKMKIKEVLGDFIRTKEYVHSYQRVVKVVKELYAFYRLHGFDGSWVHVWKSLDSQNVEQAYEVRRDWFKDEYGIDGFRLLDWTGMPRKKKSKLNVEFYHENGIQIDFE